MKKIFLLLFILFLFTCKSSSFKEVPEKDKIRILIAKANPEIYKLVKEKFESTGQIRIISPDDQDKALSKLKDCSTKDCTFELGKVLFAKLLLTYTTETVLQGDYTLYSYKIADVNKGVYLASSYEIVYSAGPTKYKNVEYNLYMNYFKKMRQKGEIVDETELKVAKEAKDTSFYDEISAYEGLSTKVEQGNLIDELIKSLEKKMASKSKNKLRIVFTKNGFFEEAFKSEIIQYDEVELIDDLTIEKTLSQLKKKQQCGAEDCDVQLGKIFLADYLFSCKLLRNTIREFQILPQIYNMKNAKFIDMNFKKFYGEYYASEHQVTNPIFSNMVPTLPKQFDPEIDSPDTISAYSYPTKEPIYKKRIIQLVNFLMNYTLE